MKRLLFLFIAIAIFSCNGNKNKPVVILPSTDVIIKNSSCLDSVQVFVTLQSTESAIGLFGITDSTVAKCKGTFWAKKNVEYHLNRTTPLFGAIVTFEGDNYACDAAIANGFPTGVNAFEFTVNVPNNGTEAADISCVDGVNSIIRYSVSDTINWIIGIGDYAKSFKSAQNVFPLEANCGVEGVFPYQCTDCIQKINPPTPNCFSKITNGCSDKRMCQITRTANAGGTILAEFISSTK